MEETALKKKNPPQGIKRMTAVLLLAYVLPALAAGVAPDEAACKVDSKDPIIQGGCIAIDPNKGNCIACHEISGTTLAGNLGPPLVNMSPRFPDKTKLRAQVWDATAVNPRSAMPPFGKYGILSEDEIDKIILFLLTL